MPNKGFGQSTEQPGTGAAAVESAAPPPPRKDLIVVGLGASAGGLEALQEFFDHMPADSGVGFVAVTHQHPGHASMLPELLSRHTAMPVAAAVDGARVEANHVYIAPPGVTLAIRNGVLSVSEDAEGRDASRGVTSPPATEGDAQVSPPAVPAAGPSASRRLVIDRFFRSLANDKGERAVGVVLSGTGSDGTLGLQAINSANGMTVAQAPESAQYSGMPTSAIALGRAQFVLAPAHMPAQIVRQALGALPPIESDGEEFGGAGLREIYQLVRERTGHDFSSYKRSTISRRIARRMQTHQLLRPVEYVKYLQQNTHEIDLLFKDLLISVTSFFRDPDAWESLAKTTLPMLIKSRPGDYCFRAWTPGCATGEEAYTLAMLLRDSVGEMGKHFDYQIFATDLDESAIEAARAASYPDGIAADVPKAVLDRYFIHEESRYRVRKEIREMCVFAPQNVIQDPPFTKLDLICCRNLLIYLDSETQQRLFPIFHYALKPGGVLMLGPSESIGSDSELFTAVDRKWKIFTRKELLVERRLPEFPVQKKGAASAAQAPSAPAATSASQLATLVNRMLLSRYAPACVVVNERGDIAYIHGRTGLFLEPASGRPNMNIVEMAREGLEVELSSALRRVRSGNEEVRREGVRVRSNGGHVLVDLGVSAIGGSEKTRGLYLVTLQPSAHPEAPEPTPSGNAGKVDSVLGLERELQYTRASLQTTVGELETSNEELKSTNEELQSTNEELQSSNEELETSREEMQALNEELNTVNAEMQAKLEDLSHANDDLHNLLNSTEVATVFLTMDLRIKRFTESARSLIKLIPSDVGRSIGDLKSNLKYDTLEADAREVLRTLVRKEAEIQTVDAQTFLMRIMPYRTVDNVIDGLVITFVDIKPLREAQVALRESERLLQLIADTAPLLIAYLDPELRFRFGNAAYERLTGRPGHEIHGLHIREVFGGEAYEIAKPRLEAAIGGEPQQFEIPLPLAAGGQFEGLVQLIPQRGETDEVAGLYAQVTDVTASNLGRAKLQMFEEMVETVRSPLVLLDERLRVELCNRAFYSCFGLDRQQLVGVLLYEVSGGAWDNPELRVLLEEVLPQNTTIEDFSLTQRFPHVGVKRLMLNARRLNRSRTLPPKILLAMEEVADE